MTECDGCLVSRKTGSVCIRNEGLFMMGGSYRSSDSFTQTDRAIDPTDVRTCVKCMCV